MRVVMKHQINGTRDGQDWPAPGGAIDLPDDEAASLVASGSAELQGDAPVEAAVTDESGVEAAVVDNTPKARGK
jgi:hypothetical protein